MSIGINNENLAPNIKTVESQIVEKIKFLSIRLEQT